MNYWNVFLIGLLGGVMRGLSDCGLDPLLRFAIRVDFDAFVGVRPLGFDGMVFLMEAGKTLKVLTDGWLVDNIRRKLRFRCLVIVGMGFGLTFWAKQSK